MQVPGYTAVRGIAVDRAGALVEAREDAGGRHVVIRVLSPALTTDSHLMRRVRSTAQLRESMRHPNLVTVLAVADRGRAVVYEWVDGVNLAQLSPGHPVDIAAAFVLFDDILCGLQALHQRRLLHRDLRPESVLIDGSGTVLLRDAELPSPPLHAGWRPGTPQYMAPELWHGAEPSVAADLYAAACMFAVAVNGADPFAAEDLAVLQRLHERGDIPGVSLAAPIRGLLAEGLAKDPEQRPADAARFRADLEVSAAAYLDDDWRSRGRTVLADLVRERRANPLPLPAGADVEEAEAMAGATAPASAWWRNGHVLAGALIAALALVVLVVVAASALTAPATPVQTPVPVPVTTPSSAAAITASGTGPFTAQQSPSLSLSGTPVPPSQTPVTPASSAAPPTLSSAPSPSATPTCTPLITPCT